MEEGVEGVVLGTAQGYGLLIESERMREGLSRAFDEERISLWIFSQCHVGICERLELLLP